MQLLQQQPLGNQRAVWTRRHVSCSCKVVASPAALQPIPRLSMEHKYKKMPFIGYLPEFRKDPAQFTLDLQQECVRQGEELATLELGPISFLYLFSPRHITHVLASEASGGYTKSDIDRRAVGLLIGNGLVLNEGQSHLKRRRLLMPCFTSERLAGFVDSMAQVADQTLHSLLAEVGSDHATPVNISDICTKATLSIIGRCGFGVDLAQKSSDVGHAMEYTLAYMANLARSILVPPLSIPTPANLKFKASRAQLDTIVYDIIASRRQQQESKKQQHPQTQESHLPASQQMQASGCPMHSTGSGEDPQPEQHQQQQAGVQQSGRVKLPQMDLLDNLLNARDEDGHGLTDLELRDETMTMVLAGHETSANALAWTMYFLSTRPDICFKVREEVLRVVGPTGSVQMRHLQDLRYTEAVLREGLRMRPAVWAFDRQAARDDVLPGGYKVQTGNILLLSPYAAQHNPAHFPQPFVFDPTRFLEGGSAASAPKGSYFPFGSGSRSCIGSTFAMFEMKVLLATWLRNFVPQLHEKSLPVASDALITLRPHKPLYMTLQPCSA